MVGGSFTLLSDAGVTVRELVVEQKVTAYLDWRPMTRVSQKPTPDLSEA